jgi:hypothetical protein
MVLELNEGNKNLAFGQRNNNLLARVVKVSDYKLGIAFAAGEVGEVKAEARHLSQSLDVGCGFGPVLLVGADQKVPTLCFNHLQDSLFRLGILDIEEIRGSAF